MCLPVWCRPGHVLVRGMCICIYRGSLRETLMLYLSLTAVSFTTQSNFGQTKFAHGLPAGFSKLELLASARGSRSAYRPDMPTPCTVVPEEVRFSLLLLCVYLYMCLCLCLCMCMCRLYVLASRPAHASAALFLCSLLIFQRQY